MIREIIQTLACLSVLNGSTLSLHLSNDHSAAEHSNSGGGGSPLIPHSGVTGTLQHHSSNPYRRMAAAAESERERMLFMAGGLRGRPIVTGRLHLTAGGSDGGAADYQPSSLTMLQDSEFPIRREPFFFAGEDDEDDDGDVGDGGGGGFQEAFQTNPKANHYHRYEDGSFEVMDDIFNRDEGIYRKFPPIHHQAAPQYNAPSPRGLQELFEHHENGGDEPNHRSLDIRLQKKMQRKRTQPKQDMEKLKSSGSKPSQSSSSSATAASAASNVPASSNSHEQQSNTNNYHQKQQQQQQQQQLLTPNGNSKRSGINSGGIGAPPVTHSIASQLMLRTARGQRQYDVPQIECPSAIDGMERFACPTPDLQGRYRCIDDHVLCDGFIDCPEGEDEDRRSCMFYKTTKAHLDVLADALLRWARGR